MTCNDCKYSFHYLWTPLGYIECELHNSLMPDEFMCGDLQEKNENQNGEMVRRQNNDKDID